ncbi:PepSY domain-containing protein [Cupriavidus gilardii]|uniref:PepSY-associated TM helix domain-containing protein n=1 Tax=Cupriavidus gilardii TaxID=82541 RepID=UPI0021C12A04|nr:PepSY-associated TM helix domain-containing protein [Cupriavidus gilardii]MCT9118753.1 PepSY domain-containing protein [Cupriavidus gilardii]
MKAATLRVYQTLHTWVGLMAGWALFIAFFAGAITVFHHELHEWQSPARIRGETHTAAKPSPEDLDRFVATLVKAHPEAAASVYIGLPTEGEPHTTAYWMDAKGEWQTTNEEKLGAGRTSPQDTSLDGVRGELSNFLNALHYTLGLPMQAGMHFMGVVSVLYGLALVSGVLLHLPRLKKDLFAVRPGRNLKRFWMDAHNVIGLFSLPFHLVIAITGALFCVSMTLAMAFNVLTFDGKLMSALPTAMSSVPEVQAAGKPAPLMPARELIEIAQRTAGDGFKPNSVRYQRVGDANALIEVRGDSERALGNFGSVGIHAAAGQPDSGRVIANQTVSGRDANHGLYSALFALHFGTYGDLALRLVYLIAGLAGAFLFYSGNLLWIESRRKARQAEQPRVHRLLAQATVGVCIGCCVGVAVAFTGALLWPERPSSFVYFPVFFAALAWALLRPPVRAAIELLYAAALAYLAVPVANAILTGDHLLRSVRQGEWAVAGFDIGALVFAVGFVALARATQRRARTGPADSVWAPRPSRGDPGPSAPPVVDTP